MVKRGLPSQKNLTALFIFFFRFVLDALRKPIDSNMSWFGLIALDRYKILDYYK